MRRKPTRASSRQSRRRIHDPHCSFETLEPRQLLAVAAFDSLTGTLDITFEQSDSIVSIGTSNQFLTITDAVLPSPSSAHEIVPLSQIRNLKINGAARSIEQAVTLEMTGSITALNSSVLQNVMITDVNEVYFAGELEIGNQLVINLGLDKNPLSPAPEVNAIRQSDTSSLTINGGTRLWIENGNIDLSNGANEFAGFVSIYSTSATGTVKIVDAGELLLGDIKVQHDLKISATSIANQPEAIVIVGDTLFVNADSIVLGDNSMDYLNARKLNFKSSGDVRVSADSGVTLVGSSFSENAAIQSIGSIRDGVSARTNVNHQFRAVAAAITLGDTGTDEFNAGHLSLKTPGTARISENSSTLFDTQSNVGSLHVQSSGDILDSNTSIILVTSNAIFSGANIIIGESPADRFEAGRVNLNSSGEVIVFSNKDFTVFGSNTAFDMTLHAVGGMLTDEAGSQTVVQNQTTLSGDAITFGKSSTFMTNTLTLKSSGNVTVHEFNDMMLVGDNTANSFRLSSPGQISNRANATLAATYRLDLAAASMDLGNQIADNFQFSSLRFNTTGHMNLQSDANILIVLDNHARSINLLSTGNILDQPGANTLIEQTAVFTGVDVVLGDGPGECFNVLSDILAVFASGISNVTQGC